MPGTGPAKISYFLGMCSLDGGWHSQFASFCNYLYTPIKPAAAAAAGSAALATKNQMSAHTLSVIPK